MKTYKALKYIKEVKAPLYSLGICDNVANLTGDLFNIPSEVVKDWEHFSGSLGFPVGGAGEYARESRENTIWKNPKRWELLDLLIDYYTPWYVKLWNKIK